MARQQALWSRFTGADLGAIQKLSGQAKRYAGEDNAVSTAYGGLMAQGMGKGQFAEFLNSLERVMAEGIAQGFTRSTEEIAENMAMLYRLSGGSPLWQGEQGAQRLSQMNSAISSATGLQSVEDVISYSAAKAWFDKIYEETPGDFEVGDKIPVGPGKNDTITYTGTYVDTMQLIERGFSAEIAKGQWDMIKQYSNGDPAAMIEHLMKMYNMNYTGGVKLWEMFGDAEKTGWDAPNLKENIDEITNNIEYKSDSALLQNELNTMNGYLAQLGQKEFQTTELPAIQTAVEQIRDHLYRAQEITPTPEDPRENLPVVIPPTADNLHDARINGGIYQRLLTAPQNIEDRYSALVNVVTGGVSMERSPHAPPEYWIYRAAMAAATGETSPGGKEITSNELSELIQVLRNLATALGKDDIFSGKSDQEFHLWLTGENVEIRDSP